MYGTDLVGMPAHPLCPVIKLRMSLSYNEAEMCNLDSEKNEYNVAEALWWLIIEARRAEGAGDYDNVQFILSHMTLLLNSLAEESSLNVFKSQIETLSTSHIAFLRATRATNHTHGF